MPSALLLTKFSILLTLIDGGGNRRLQIFDILRLFGHPRYKNVSENYKL